MDIGSQKGCGRPGRVARTFPLRVARRPAYPRFASYPGHGRERRVDHTISEVIRSVSTSNSGIGDPHACPPETALIPV